MTTPNQHPFWMSWCRDEFGGHGGDAIWLSWYYADGVLVPVGTTGANGAIPSSGYITLDHLRNAPAGFYSGSLVAGYNQGWYGFWYDLGMGSLNPTAAMGTDIRAAMWKDNQFHFYLWGNIGNQGFTSLGINGTAWRVWRTNASYSLWANGSAWVWGGVPNPFTNGAGHTLLLF